MAKVQNVAPDSPEKGGPGAPVAAAGEAGQPGGDSSPAPGPEKALEQPPEGPAKPPEGPENQPPAKPKVVSTERPYLDSPRPFGIQHGGLTHRFPKGKTKLSEEMADVLENDPYVSDNGAEVVR